MGNRIDDMDAIDHFIVIARHNLIALAANLAELGYEFANANGAVQLADDAARQAVRALEEEKGKLPAIYRTWYESFRCVDFSQAAAQLQGKHRLAGLGLNCPLITLDIDSCLRLQRQLSSYAIRIRNANSQELIPFGGSASNCEPVGVWVPSDTLDPVVYDDGAGPVTMSQDIIAACEAGGFPFWAKMYRKHRFVSPIGVAPPYKEILPVLRRNLQNF